MIIIVFIFVEGLLHRIEINETSVDNCEDMSIMMHNGLCAASAYGLDDCSVRIFIILNSVIFCCVRTNFPRHKIHEENINKFLITNLDFIEYKSHLGQKITSSSLKFTISVYFFNLN